MADEKLTNRPLDRSLRLRGALNKPEEVSARVSKDESLDKTTASNFSCQVGLALAISIFLGHSWGRGTLASIGRHIRHKAPVQWLSRTSPIFVGTSGDTSRCALIHRRSGFLEDDWRVGLHSCCSSTWVVWLGTPNQQRGSQGEWPLCTGERSFEPAASLVGKAGKGWAMENRP